MSITNKNKTTAELLWEKAENNIMDGTYLYSKMPSVSVNGVTPIYFKKGLGSYAWDLDNKKYLDLSMGLGPCFLGYSNTFVNHAVMKQMNEGVILSLPHPIEVKAAELLNEIIPSSGLVRFLKSGAEANLAAIRIARAFTGREMIICGGYHGWHDWSISLTSRSSGIPEFNKDLVKKAEYNNFELYEDIFHNNKHKIAAVMIEPIEFEQPTNDFLKKLLELCHDNGALLIFDEVVTGFRFDLGGAQKYFNVTPDISTFGKAIANGYPLAAVVGKKDIISKVKDDVFISSTYGGECLSLAAFIATVQFIRDNQVYDHVFSIGKIIKDGINKINISHGSGISCIGMPPRMNFKFESLKNTAAIDLKTLFLQEMMKRGVYYVWNILPNYSMK